MANKSSGGESLADKMRGMEINPIVPIVAAVMIVLFIGYFGWLRPKMADDRAVRDFNTPEAQAKRDPDQKKVSAELQAQISAMRTKEQHFNTGTTAHRRRDD